MQQHSSATRLGLTHVHMPYFPHLFTSCSSLSSTARTYKSITPGVCSIKDTQSGSRKKVECRLSGHTDTHVVSCPGLQCHPAHSGQTINFSHKFSVLGSQLLRLFRGMCWAMLGIEAYTMCYWDVQWFTRSEARLGALGRDLLSRILLSQCFTGRSLFIFDDLWWMLLR